MELLIEISPEKYMTIFDNVQKGNYTCPITEKEIVKIIAEGVPIMPHGDLIDRDEIEYHLGVSDKDIYVSEIIQEAPVIIKKKLRWRG